MAAPLEALLLLRPVRAQELASAEMLGVLAPEALDELVAHAIPRRYGTGELVFAEGDAGASLHVVRSGRFGVVRPSRDPGVVLSELRPGQAFGELAVLNSAPRLASIIALEPAETVELLKADVERVLDAHPSAARRMLGVLARSLTLAKEDAERHNQRLEVVVRDRTAELRDSQAEVVRRLSQAAESRDEDTGLHIVRMSHLAQELALACGVGADAAELLLHAAPMHDVGKIAIPDSILLKPGRLDPAERAVMQRHAALGAELLAGSRSPVVRLGEEIALTHHERWDGTGYPHGLRGEAIPPLARITAVVDVFDALISERPYKPAWSPADALAEIRRLSGSHFDPSVVDVFGATFTRLIDTADAVGRTHVPAPPGDAAEAHRLLAGLRSG